MKLSVGWPAITPYYARAICWYGTFCKAVLTTVASVVAEVHACEVDVLVGGVIQFEPVTLLSIVADIYVVAGADLVDADRRSTQLPPLPFSFNRSKDGGKPVFRSLFEQIHDVQAFGGRKHVLFHSHHGQRGLEEDVGTGSRGVLHLHGYLVDSRLQQFVGYNDASPVRL